MHEKMEENLEVKLFYSAESLQTFLKDRKSSVVAKEAGLCKILVLSMKKNQQGSAMTREKLSLYFFKNPMKILTAEVITLETFLKIVRQCLRDRNISYVSKKTQVSRNKLYDIMNGKWDFSKKHDSTTIEIIEKLGSYFLKNSPKINIPK